MKKQGENVGAVAISDKTLPWEIVKAYVQKARKGKFSILQIQSLSDYSILLRIKL